METNFHVFSHKLFIIRSWSRVHMLSGCSETYRCLMVLCVSWCPSLHFVFKLTSPPLCLALLACHPPTFLFLWSLEIFHICSTLSEQHIMTVCLQPYFTCGLGKKNILLLMLFYLITRFSFAFQLCFLCCEGVKIDKYSSYCGSLSFLLSHNGLFIFCFTGP